MGTIADKRLGDFLPTIDAYRPVALTVAAVLALVILVPGAGGDTPSSTDEFASTPATATATDPDPSSTSPASSTTTVPAAAPDTAPTASDDPVAPGSSGTPSAPPTTSAPETTSPPTTTSFRAPPVGGSDDDEPEPLRIAASGWATVAGGTPLAGSPADEVPEGTLPVGTRVGQTDKMSFVRLSGDETTLLLAEDDDGRRGNEFETSPVEVCQITEAGWSSGEAQPMAEAPEYDAENCIAARENPDGTWAVSLFQFEDPTDDRGVALVPSADAPLDFQVTFAARALG